MYPIQTSIGSIDLLEIHHYHKSIKHYQLLGYTLSVKSVNYFFKIQLRLFKGCLDAKSGKYENLCQGPTDRLTDRLTDGGMFIEPVCES